MHSRSCVALYFFFRDSWMQSREQAASHRVLQVSTCNLVFVLFGETVRTAVYLYSRHKRASHGEVHC